VDDPLPWADQHTTPDAPRDAVIYSGDGRPLTFHCFHAHCTDRTWRDLREHYEPSITTGLASPTGFRDTELGNAERLVAAYRDRIRYSTEIGWLVWDGRRWESNTEISVEAMGTAVARGLWEEIITIPDSRARLELARWARQSEKRSSVSAMVGLARVLDGVPIRASEIDTDPWLLNVSTARSTFIRASCAHTARPT